MSVSNIGARKSRNIRDHLFVVNAVLNEAINGPNKKALDIQIFDVQKCFDKLEYVDTMNCLFTAGVQNDKFILIANSNKECKVSVKMPWRSKSRSTTINNVEMQGTVLAPLKCSISIDRIGKEALDHMQTNLHKYKGCVTIPPLSMIDDILAVSTCSLDSIKVNATIVSKVNNKQLTMSSRKCSRMHIGNKKTSCRPLQVEHSVMNTSSKEKYLGSILTNDGKILENISDRHNKGIGTVNQIICILKDINFGQYYFEMTTLFRSSMLLNGMLHSIEALHGLKQVHIDKLEACDKFLLRKAFNAVSTTATEAFYIELGILPLRFAVVARRLMFFWTILNKPDSELVKQVFNAQKLAPLKDDWISQIEDDLRKYNIHLSENEIRNLKKDKFKEIVKTNIREEGRKYLLSLKNSHSKSKGLDIKMSMQPYLVTKALSLQEKQILFKFRTYTYECKANYKNKFHADLKCIDCGQLDTQEHIFDCSLLSISDVKHSDIFGTLEEQCKAAKLLAKINQLRSQIDLKSSLGSHVHTDPPCKG